MFGRAINYDYDIVPIAPDTLFEDPRMAQALQQAGITQNMAGNTVALFRSKRTVSALKTLPKVILDVFDAAGYGFRATNSRLPAGRFPAKDDDHRLYKFKRFSELLGQIRPLTEAERAQMKSARFKLEDFAQAEAKVRPI